MRILPVLALFALLAPAAVLSAAEPIDFNRDIRPILSGTCFTCHGPDEATRKAKLRLDTREGALAEKSGRRAVVPSDPSASELLRRVTAEDRRRMPPAKSGKRLDAAQVRLLERWIQEGAPYAPHWAYVPPVRPPLPERLKNAGWVKNGADRFILERLEREGLGPSPEADRHALARRLSMDLIGLPPTPEEVDAFAADASPDAYEKLLERLLSRPAYGEHWARLWLDLARYADSSGYADDPPRTIWAYRDYVIDSFNADKPFDRFTVEQIAGDLLPSPSEEALVATAFHRNTQTNNEGGTNDEEYRSVAIVDRVNTTLAVWMGTTAACAQCHNHKYDPITQEEYFRLFAILNNTEDADRLDETPVIPLYSEEQIRHRKGLEAEAARLETLLRTPTPELTASQGRWEERLAPELAWRALPFESLESREGAAFRRLDDGSVLVERTKKTDVDRLLLPLPAGPLSALRLETLADPSLPGQGPGRAGGNFVITGISAAIIPPGSARLSGRFVRLELPGKERILSLAEVQVLSGSENAALAGEARQSSTDHEGHARLAIDGNTDGRYAEKRSTTHTATSESPWWEVDLKSERPLDRLVVWNRTDNGLQKRLAGFRLLVLDASRKTVWERTVAEAPDPKVELSPSGVRPVALAAAIADHSQPGFEARSVLRKKNEKGEGWAVGGQTGKPHALTLLPESAEEVAEGSRLSLEIEQLSKHDDHTLGRFRVSASGDPRAGELARLPAKVLAILRAPREKRVEADRAELQRYYLASAAPELEKDRAELARTRKELAELKPRTTVPVLRELAADRRRKTQVQRRGNFLDLAQEVAEGVPAVFHPLPEGAPPDRLALARWLVDRRNPLTARVIANRYWERLFGTGLVATSEEFGAQGELPSHPELLDWLAVELVEGGWSLKGFLRLLAGSATYRQSSRVTPELRERDPENRLLSRGPRLRLTAEEVRDQALLAAGLLSAKVGGPPVRPPQPSVGLTAAFGGGIDWQTSEGEDRYRRGLYTTWRRSSPYPSMAVFDAPNREVCILRRASTNTPLQALVTLNDPVYVEAAQALARRMAAAEGTAREKARLGFRLLLSRPPEEEEVARLVRLQEEARERFAREPEKAMKLATVPRGPLPAGADAADLAAWTVVGNVLLNLDEALMKR